MKLLDEKFAKLNAKPANRWVVFILLSGEWGGKRKRGVGGCAYLLDVLVGFAFGFFGGIIFGFHFYIGFSM